MITPLSKEVLNKVSAGIKAPYTDFYGTELAVIEKSNSGIYASMRRIITQGMPFFKNFNSERYVGGATSAYFILDQVEKEGAKPIPHVDRDTLDKYNDIAVTFFDIPFTPLKDNDNSKREKIYSKIRKNIGLLLGEEFVLFMEELGERELGVKNNAEFLFGVAEIAMPVELQKAKDENRLEEVLAKLEGISA